MNLTDVNAEEKKRITAWAAKYAGYGDISSTESRKTYYMPFDNKDNCVDYGFDDMLELKAQLLKIWGNEPIMQEVMIPCMVAAFKGRPRQRKYKINNEQVVETANGMDIPEFIYVF